MSITNTLPESVVMMLLQQIRTNFENQLQAQIDRFQQLQHQQPQMFDVRVHPRLLGSNQSDELIFISIHQPDDGDTSTAPHEEKDQKHVVVQPDQLRMHSAERPRCQQPSQFVQQPSPRRQACEHVGWPSMASDDLSTMLGIILSKISEPQFKSFLDCIFCIQEKALSRPLIQGGITENQSEDKFHRINKQKLLDKWQFLPEAVVAQVFEKCRWILGEDDYFHFQTMDIDEARGSAKTLNLLWLNSNPSASDGFRSCIRLYSQMRTEEGKNTLANALKYVSKRCHAAVVKFIVVTLVSQRYWEAVRCVIEQWTELYDVNQIVDDGVTLLYRASENNVIEFVKYLLDHGARPDVGNVKTPILEAIVSQNISLLRLYKTKSSLFVVNSTSETTLIHACERGSTEIIQLVLDDTPADQIDMFSTRTSIRCTALCEAIKSGCDMNAIEMLLNKGATINFPRSTPSLTAAIGCGRIDVIQCLLQNRARLRNDSMQNVFHDACRYDQPAVIQFLFRYLPPLEVQSLLQERSLESVDAQDCAVRNMSWGALCALNSSETEEKKESVIHASTSHGIFDAVQRNDVQFFKGLTADHVKVRDGEGWTPLHRAAFAGNSRIVFELIRLEPQLINAREYNSGNTALHYAALKNKYFVAKQLISVSAQIVQNKNGEYPQDLAQNPFLQRVINPPAKTSHLPQKFDWSAAPTFVENKAMNRGLNQFIMRFISEKLPRRESKENRIMNLSAKIQIKTYHTSKEIFSSFGLNKGNLVIARTIVFLEFIGTRFCLDNSEKLRKKIREENVDEINALENFGCGVTRETIDSIGYFLNDRRLVLQELMKGGCESYVSQLSRVVLAPSHIWYQEIVRVYTEGKDGSFALYQILNYDLSFHNFQSFLLAYAKVLSDGLDALAFSDYPGERMVEEYRGICYRCISLPEEEMNGVIKLLESRIGGEIILPAYVSTSRDKRQAIPYGNVLWIFDLGKSVRPGYSVEKVSRYRDEHEVLLAPGLVYGIDDIIPVTSEYEGSEERRGGIQYVIHTTVYTIGEEKDQELRRISANSARNVF